MKLSTSNFLQTAQNNIRFLNILSINNLFDKNTVERTIFTNNNEAVIYISNVEFYINSFAIYDTNAEYAVIEMYSTNGDFYSYPLSIEGVENNLAYLNIKQQTIDVLIIRLFKPSNDDEFYCNYIFAGMGVIMPPFNTKSVQDKNRTREQYFSESGNYFSQQTSMKTYDTWSVNFDFLSQEQKKTIEYFITENNDESFVFQLYTGGNSFYFLNSVLSIVNKNITPIMSGYPLMKPYIKRINELREEYIFIREDKETYMSPGLYALTTQNVKYTKSDNIAYPWKTALDFRQVF